MNNTRRITYTALFLALAIILPFITIQVPTIGKLLTPMHFPVIIASFFVGPLYALLVGFVAPLLRMLLFGMPPFPISLMMAFELASYAVVAGVVYQVLKQSPLSKVIKIYIALVPALIVGRIVYALTALIFLENAMFIPVFTGAFTGSFVGIILQLILIPILVIRFDKNE